MRVFRFLPLLAVVACVDKSPPAPAVDPGLIAENLLAAPPADITNRVDATLGTGVVYLGNTIEYAHPGPVVPGDRVSITHYWQVNQPPGKNWRVFSHLVGDQGDFANVDLTDMRKGHPPDVWRAGEVIRDPQTFILRKDWKSSKAVVSLGIYKKGGHKITDRMPITGAPSKDNAVVVAILDVDVSKVPPPPGTVVVKKATGPFSIDGKADEPSWQAAASTAGFVTAEGGPEPKGVTAAKLTYDDQNLYVFVSADDEDVASEYTKTDEPIWKADVVEIFIDADASGKGYVELQVSPTNVQFDTWYAVGRPNDDKSYAAGMTSAVNVRGTVNQAGGEADKGWDVEIAIPLAAVKGLDAAMNVRLPPQPGDTWRLNIVRTDYPKAGQPAAASWNKIRYSDFHSIDRLLTIRFADAAGNLAPPAEAPAAPGTAPAAPAAPGTAPAVPGTAPAAPAAPGTAPAAPAPGSAPALTPGAAAPAGGAVPAPGTTPTIPTGSATPGTAPPPKPAGGGSKLQRKPATN